jgi:hypothetical protein
LTVNRRCELPWDYCYAFEPAHRSARVPVGRVRPGRRFEGAARSRRADYRLTAVLVVQRGDEPPPAAGGGARLLPGLLWIRG